ncbi:17-beta-hydroxysteroid dehydrogenase type 3 [Lampris incognitus]|uniref:17-beta-hydroxysteroid dehydrogenase type 3 n=1 Tax=Lampris incognitus TaxID=2546036 RepID=UPI0024B56B51|nr:17-beta-hydroxysteroid dehydrogenase type 3 [Lampris incognitus]
MDFMELLLVSLGSAIVFYYGVKLLLFSKILYPKLWFPLPKSFFTSMGEWAVVTGGSDGIGKAYAFELAAQGMNVVILSRTKEKLDKIAKEIGDTTGQKVKVIVADFTEETVFDEIENNLMDLKIGVLVNNVGILPTLIPSKFLETPDLEKAIVRVINCNVKTMAKMCRITLPGMENRGKGVIINISSGTACVNASIYSLYSSSKVFVETFSQALQAEYKDKGIIIQTVAPFGVSTNLSGYQRTNMVTITAEDFVKTSLQHIRAGDKTYGSVCHAVLAWILQSIPHQILSSEAMQIRLKEYVKKRIAAASARTSTS